MCCAYLNAPSTTMLTRTDVSNTDLFHAMVATDVLALTAPQLNMLQLAGLAQTIDFTNPNVATGLTAIFPATSKTYANILALSQRAATRLEAIFTTSAVSSQYGAQIDVPTLIEALT